MFLVGMLALCVDSGPVSKDTRGFAVDSGPASRDTRDSGSTFSPEQFQQLLANIYIVEHEQTTTSQ